MLLNLIIHYGNAKQNTMRYWLIPTKMDINKIQIIKILSKMWRIAGRNVSNSFTLEKKIWKFLKILHRNSMT